MDNNLITVRQLPIIEERLHEVKAAVEERVNNALSLAVTEETYKDVKKVRTALSKEFSEFEERRKAIKKAISEPYECFEKIYTECVSSMYKKADSTMKERISSIESDLKAKKSAEAESYFNEYAKSLDIDFLGFKDSGIKVDMTITPKKLKEQVKAFLDKISEDLDMLSALEDAAELLTEYKKCLNAVSAIAVVTERKRKIQEEKEKIISSAKNEEPEDSSSEAFIKPTAVLEKPKEVKDDEDDTEYCLKFTVYGSKAQLKELKNFIVRSGMRYE